MASHSTLLFVTTQTLLINGSFQVAGLLAIIVTAHSYQRSSLSSLWVVKGIKINTNFRSKVYLSTLWIAAGYDYAKLPVKFSFLTLEYLIMTEICLVNMSFQASAFAEGVMTTQTR